jgi:hypothetical protein
MIADSEKTGEVPPLPGPACGRERQRIRGRLLRRARGCASSGAAGAASRRAARASSPAEGARPRGSSLAAASASCSGLGRDTSLARIAALSVIFMLTTDSSLP